MSAGNQTIELSSLQVVTVAVGRYRKAG